MTARFVRWLRWLHPVRRPMDNMPDGFDYPHEDEFALCSMGLRSPYEQWAFPNRPQGEEFLDFCNVGPAEIDRWKSGLRWFLKTLTLRSGKPIVLKSPPHTARIRLLLELFPNARFVHIVRHPFAVLPSTLWTWQSVFRKHGLQKPNFDGLDEYFYRVFLRMHRAYEDQKRLIPPENLCEVRYEDLIADPIGEMAAIYKQLNLGEFDRVRPKLEAYLASQKDYATNRYRLTPEMRREIARRCSGFMRQYGYSTARDDELQPSKSQRLVRELAASGRRAA